MDKINNRLSSIQAHEEGDPFGEGSSPVLSRRVVLLGGDFEFHSHSAELLERLVDLAYAGLPPHRFENRQVPRFEIELRLTEGDPLEGDEPPAARMQGGAGFFCALMDAANFAIVNQAQRSGVVGISRALLQRFPYHARYELLEFAVFLLASRAQQLVPLHAACVGENGVGLLLLGQSGAGKSTLALHCLLQGLDFLSEDAAFVEPASLQAAGLANFLHLRRADGLALVDDAGIEAQLKASPVIRRRSGVEKYELDLRQPWAKLAPAPLKIAGLVFLSGEPASDEQDLSPMLPAQWLPRFMAAQAYAALQAGWPLFEQHLPRLAAFELKRSRHPRESAQALRALLAGSPRG